MPMKTDREYRNFTFEVRELLPEEGDKMVVRGYASTFNEPYTLYNDGQYIFREQVDPHAFDEADLSDVILQYNHEGRVFARTSNGTLQVSVDDKGFAVEADLGGTEIGRQLYEEIKGGYTTKMSFGFVVTEDRREETENREKNTYEVLRTITKIGKVYDVSAVSIPANDGTSISSRNLVDGLIKEIEEERLKALELERQRLLTRIKLGGIIND